MRDGRIKRQRMGMVGENYVHGAHLGCPVDRTCVTHPYAVLFCLLSRRPSIQLYASRTKKAISRNRANYLMELCPLAKGRIFIGNPPDKTPHALPYAAATSLGFQAGSREI